MGELLRWFNRQVRMYVRYVRGLDGSLDTLSPDVRKSIVSTRRAAEIGRWLTILTALASLYMVYLTQFDRGLPVVYHNEPFTVLTPVVSPGSELAFVMDFTVVKHTDSLTTFVWKEVNTGGYTTGESFPVSYDSRWSRPGRYIIEATALVPPLRDGRYVLELNVTQRTNWLHEETYAIITEAFDVSGE